MKALIVVSAALMALALGGTYFVAGDAGAAAGDNRATLTCVFYQQFQRRQVDPIVAPGIQQSAHLHDFYGRQDISDYMFAAAPWPPVPGHENDPGYIPKGSSCRTYGDWAGYWFPTPKLNGANILSGELQSTWTSPAGSSVAVPPFGMAFVADNTHLRWTCGDLDGPGYAAPVDCTGLGTVTAELTFPNCWDGANRIGNDYFPAGIKPTHFTYGDFCPASHPTRIAQLVTRQHFIDPANGQPLVNPLDAGGNVVLSFASGAANTYHGDFLNSWNEGLGMIVDGCLNRTRSCPSLK
jgi:uncharacterized protein DUF1996